ncbi:hypothetical protein WME94_02375 [Sorangium sp. So ce429]
MINRSLRIACFLVCAASAAATAGCVVTVEPLVRYEGTDETAHVEYIPTQSVRIVSVNGQVDVTTGNVSDVQVTFSPFTMRKEGERELAIAEIENQLELSAKTQGEIVIEVDKVGSNISGYLGADIRVVLPANFDGGLRVDQNNGSIDVDLDGAPSLATTIASENGSIDVVGARGEIHVATQNGSVSVDLDAWSDADGSITSGNGSIELSVPADVDGTMTAHTDLGEISEHNLPSTWATASNDGGTSYTMGDGDGGLLELSTELGDINIIAR